MSSVGGDKKVLPRDRDIQELVIEDMQKAKIQN
jgi:hypothetical protein